MHEGHWLTAMVLGGHCAADDDCDGRQVLETTTIAETQNRPKRLDCGWEHCTQKRCRLRSQDHTAAMNGVGECKKWSRGSTGAHH